MRRYMVSQKFIDHFEKYIIASTFSVKSINKMQTNQNKQ
jgi:hypothetical protein